MKMENKNNEIEKEDQMQSTKTEFKLMLNLIFRNRLTLVGAVIVVGFIIIAFIGIIWTPFNPLTTDVDNRLQPPTFSHLFGTDELGRDILSRVMAGTRYSLWVASMVVVLSVTIGTVAGLTAAWFRGKIDDIIMRIADIFLAMPQFVLAMAISAALGPSLQNVMLAIVAVYWPAFARLMRAQALSIKTTPYIDAARQMQASSKRIMFKHIFPNAFPPILVYATLEMGIAIIIASSLSFLGFGAQPPTPEWGLIVASSRHYIEVAPSYTLITGLVMVIAVLGFNLLGDGLRDALDPRLRRIMEASGQ